MPHLIVEISQGVQVDGDELLSAVNHALFATEQFKYAKDIKSRIHRTDVSLIGLGVDDGELFVSAQLLIMAGRDDKTKHALVETVLTTLQTIIGRTHTNVQYAVDLQELSPYYQKAII